MLSDEQVTELAWEIHTRMLGHRPDDFEDGDEEVIWEGESSFLPWYFTSGESGIGFLQDVEMIIPQIKIMLLCWDGQGLSTVGENGVVAYTFTDETNIYAFEVKDMGISNFRRFIEVSCPCRVCNKPIIDEGWGDKNDDLCAVCGIAGDLVRIKNHIREKGGEFAHEAIDELLENIRDYRKKKEQE